MSSTLKLMLSKAFGRKYLQFQKEKYVGSFDLMGVKFWKWLKRKDFARTKFCKSARIKAAKTCNINVTWICFLFFFFFFFFNVLIKKKCNMFFKFLFTHFYVVMVWYSNILSVPFKVSMLTYLTQKDTLTFGNNT